MNRSPLAVLCIALIAVMAVVAGVATSVAAPPAAGAQVGTTQGLTLHISDVSNEQQLAAAAVALDPGESNLAALGATLRYDTSVVVVHECAISEVGACNVLDDGQVLMSVFNLAGLKANDQLMTISFEPVPGATRDIDFEILVTTAVNHQGEKVDSFGGDRAVIEPAAPAFGSLTGTVVANETQTALYDIDVCAVHDSTGTQTCTVSTGLGNWRIDDVVSGSYSITVSDRTGVYAETSGVGVVAEDQVMTVADLAMDFLTPESSDPSDDDEAPSAAGPVDVPGRSVIEIVYGASISGRVVALTTEAGVEAVQVCATQPHVLHQSCATSGPDGSFELTGLSSGNYWIDVVDPLGQLEQARPKLVGLARDNAERTGLNIALVTASE